METGTQHAEAGPALRDRLVQTGVDLLEQDGLAGLSLRAITRRTGVSHGAPRRHFPTHNALLAAIAGVGLADLVADLAPVLGAAAEAPAADRLVDLGLRYVGFAERRPAMFELIFRHDLLEGTGENLRRISLPLFAALVDLVRAATGDADGARERALGLWSNLHGLAVLVANQSLRLVDGEFDRPRLVAAAVHAYLAR